MDILIVPYFTVREGEFILTLSSLSCLLLSVCCCHPVPSPQSQELLTSLIIHSTEVPPLLHCSHASQNLGFPLGPWAGSSYLLAVHSASTSPWGACPTSGSRQLGKHKWRTRHPAALKWWLWQQKRSQRKFGAGRGPCRGGLMAC